MKLIKGKSVFGGSAIGELFIVKKVQIDIPNASAEDTAEELKRLHNAISDADKKLTEHYEIAVETVGKEDAEIFEMHKLMLTDEDFTDALNEKIESAKMNVLKAVDETCKEFVAFFEGLDDEYMRVRALDVRDVCALLIEILTGVKTSNKLVSPSIVIAEDLTPGETIQMDKKNILAFVLKEGSSNSHTAILARTMGIPSIVQADFEINELKSGVLAAVDGTQGLCYIEPNEATLTAFKEQVEKDAVFKRECEAMRGLPTVTKSGREIKIYANIGCNEDISSVLSNDAQGIGLFRSEFLYLGRDTPPNEEVQFAAYKNVAEKMQGKKVIIRTMDIGADKQVDYLGIPEEENPALGYRAIRICLDRRDLFQTQLRAICRASVFGNIAVMFPMISSLWEIIECKKSLDEAIKSLTEEKIPVGKTEIGIMIETPAAAILCDVFAKEVDFFSVGTNDLTQYTLAVDRQNQKLERYADPYHPAILEMLSKIALCAKNNNIWAGVCGELAGDFTMTEKFIDMGFSELSVAPPLILPLRKAIREM